MARFLFVLTSHDKKGDTGEPTGFYLPEVTHPHKVLVENGHSVDFVSIKGGEAPMDGVDLEDPINRAFLDHPIYSRQIKQTATLADITPQDYDALFIPGGHGTMWDLPDHLPLQHHITAIYEQGGVVGAVCHGPAGLVNVRLSNGRYLVAGKEISCFTNEEEIAVELADAVPFLLADRLEERGATHTKAPNFEKHVVVSERLVTGQNPASGAGVAEAMLEVLTIS